MAGLTDDEAVSLCKEPDPSTKVKKHPRNSISPNLFSLFETATILGFHISTNHVSDQRSEEESAVLHRSLRNEPFEKVGFSRNEVFIVFHGIREQI